MSVGLPEVEPTHASKPEPAVAHPEPILTVIEPRGGWSTFDFRERWRFRELLAFLIWRDVKIRDRKSGV